MFEHKVKVYIIVRDFFLKVMTFEQTLSAKLI